MSILVFSSGYHIIFDDLTIKHCFIILPVKRLIKGFIVFPKYILSLDDLILGTHMLWKNPEPMNIRNIH